MGDPPEAIRSLRPMTDGIVPIGDDERKARIDARRLMAENRLDAIFSKAARACLFTQPSAAIDKPFA